MGLKVFIGWDSREDIAYEVAKHSIHKYNPDIEVIPLKQYELRNQGLYTRPEDKQGSTEFTITRFLVPYLSGFKGVSLFMDCDMILTDDIAKILDEVNVKQHVVSCVQHDYNVIGEALTDTKMDGKKQHFYPRKNWSSVMLFNNAQCDNLTPEVVNTASPAYLHRMNWADGSIGELHHRWNYLAGYYKDDDYKIIHYTDGGPWFKEYHNCPHGELWKECIREMYGL